jgi:hypothetical protein
LNKKIIFFVLILAGALVLFGCTTQPNKPVNSASDITSNDTNGFLGDENSLVPITGFVVEKTLNYDICGQNTADGKTTALCGNEKIFFDYYNDANKENTIEKLSARGCTICALETTIFISDFNTLDTALSNSSYNLININNDQYSNIQIGSKYNFTTQVHNVYQNQGDLQGAQQKLILLDFNSN